MDDKMVEREQMALKLRNDSFILDTQLEELAFQQILEEKAKKIEQLLPHQLNIGHFIASAIVAVNRNPKLLECTKKSLFLACIDAAEVGLDFSRSKGWAYLVPYKEQATFMPGYRGLIELSMRTGKVETIEAHLVYQHDTFTIEYGTNPHIAHIVTYMDVRGAFIGAYAVGWLVGARFPLIDYMHDEELKKISLRAKTDYIWKSDTGEMRRKTVIRRLMKYMPISPAIERALDFDNRIAGLKEIEEQEAQKTLAEKMEEKMKIITESGGQITIEKTSKNDDSELDKKVKDAQDEHKQEQGRET